MFKRRRFAILAELCHLVPENTAFAFQQTGLYKGKVALP
jgi:hypothetical protein